MSKCNSITQEELKRIVKYNDYDGLFVWASPRRHITVGDVCGSVGNEGYISITINKKTYRAHRLAWLYVYGYLPENQIDHINGDKSDNRISNLREATNSENRQNTTAKTSSASGLRGVSFKKAVNKWRAYISIDKKQFHLGYFDDKNKAHEAYLLAKAKIHKFNPVPR